MGVAVDNLGGSEEAGELGFVGRERGALDRLHVYLIVAVYSTAGFRDVKRRCRAPCLWGHEGTP